MQSTQMAINWQLCVQLANNNAEVADELLSMFVAELPQTTDDLQQLYMQQDWEGFRNCVHKLHGGACYVGVPQLKQAAKSLEHLLMEAASNDQITSQYIELLNAVEAVAEAYQDGLYKPSSQEN